MRKSASWKFRQVSAFLLAVLAVFMCLPAQAAPTATFNVSNRSWSAGNDASNNATLCELTSTFTVLNGANIIITGSMTMGNYLLIEVSGTAAITLRNASIGTLSLNDGATLTLTLADGTTNNVVSGGGVAGIRVPISATLIINGAGTLHASSRASWNVYGAGIGGNHNESAGTIIIEDSAKVTATGDTASAGIGGARGGNGGNITIRGNAQVTAEGGGADNSGAGIGGGSGGSGGNITIEGNAQVTATGGSTGGAGIGGGTFGAGGTINISGNVSVTATGGLGAAGIGGGNGTHLYHGGSGYITISGGTVRAIGGSMVDFNWNAVAYNDTAGIGSGRAGLLPGLLGPIGSINITGGLIKSVTGGGNAPPIGGRIGSETVEFFLITYNANDGTGTPARTNRSAQFDTNYTVWENVFSRSGYNLAGWNTAPDGSGTAYAADATIYNVQANITLYAQWTVMTGGFPVSVLSGGTGYSATPNPAAPGVTVSLNAGSRTGYEFAGWTSPNVTITNAANATGASFTMPASAVTITATWNSLGGNGGNNGGGSSGNGSNSGGGNGGNGGGGCSAGFGMGALALVMMLAVRRRG